MSGVQLAFLALPSLAAVLVGWAVTHWTLAAAALTGALGWLFLVPYLPGEARFLTPLFTGAGVAGLTMLLLLAIRKNTGVWSRMTVALLVTFAAHTLFLITAIANR